MNYSLILLCAGSGKRTGLKYNKIFYKINNQTVYEMNISHFLEDNRCKQIIVVTKENEIDDILHLRRNQVLTKNQIEKIISILK